MHVGLYLDLIGGALVGLIADFWLPQLGGLHELVSRQFLLILFALHVVGALWRAFVARDGALTRIILPAA